MTRGKGQRIPAELSFPFIRWLVVSSLVIPLLSMAIMLVSHGMSAGDAGGLASTPWPMFQHDPQHTGRSTYLGAQTNNLAWSYNMGGAGYSSSPAIGSDGTIYIGSANGNLYAISPNGGSKWAYANPTHLFHTPAIGSDGTIYVGSDDGNLYAITDSGSGGTLKWSYPTYQNIVSAPAIGSDGTIYFGSDDMNLHAITDSGSGATVKWSYSMTDYIRCSPAIGSDGTIYVLGHDQGNIWAIYPAGGLKYFGASGGLNGSGASPAIGSDGTVYVVDGSWLCAIGTDSLPKWQYSTGDVIQGSPAIGSDGTIYFGSKDGYLYAVTDSGSTATLKWRYSVGITVSSSAIGSDGTIYIGSENGNFYAITDSGSSGTLKWSYATGNIDSSPAIGSDGTIYVASTGGSLYAFHTTRPSITNSTGADTITSSSAHLNGNVTSTGGENPAVTIYWGLTDGGTTTSSWVNNVPMGTLGTGTFFSNVGSLSPGTKYYYRCHATNTAGDSWAASTANFTTLAGAPTVTNGSGADSITTTSANLNGNVASTGGENPTVTIYWGLTDGGTTTSSWVNNVPMGTLGTGTFFSSVGSLSPGTKYYYRCYASNTNGSSWAASAANFTTLAAAPGVTNASGADDVTTTSAHLNGNVTSTGGQTPSVTIYWGLADGATVAGNWGNHIDMGTLGAGIFFSSVGSLSPNTQYFYRCYASNTGGGSWAASTANFTTSVTGPAITDSTGADNITSNSARLNGNVTSTGGQNPSVTIYWGLADGATVAGNWGNHIDMGALGAGIFFSSVGSLSPNTRYFYRCYASNTAGNAWAPGTDNFTTSVTASAITNSTGADHIAANSARLNGNVISTGGQNPSVTIYWGLTDGGTTAGSWGHSIPMGALGAGTLSSDISSLSPNTRYFYRCYASNSAGNVWAPVTDNFTTTIPLPTIISFNPSSGGAGTTVTITGTNLTGATVVSFGGTAAASFTVNSATQITALVGSGSSGRVSVTTPSGTGTSAGDFTFNAPQNLIGTVSGGPGGGPGGGSGGGSVGTSTPGTPVSMPNVQVQSAALGSGPQVTAQVTNIGTVSGSTRVVLYVDEQAADSRDISLAPGDRKSVSFDLSGLVPGTHNVKVNNTVAGEVSVAERSDLNLFLISLAAFLVVMAGLFIAYFHRRRAM